MKKFKTPKHPTQPLEIVDGIVRFKPNKIIDYLFAQGLLDLNKIAHMPFPDEDRTQLVQLLGYSVCGFCDLSFPSDEVKDKVWNNADKLRNKKEN